MSPSPIRRVEREEHPPTRPRDAAIRQAANDNARYEATNDNDTTIGGYATVDQEFSNSYMQQGLQPSVGTVEPMRKTTVTYANNPAPKSKRPQPLKASNDNTASLRTPRSLGKGALPIKPLPVTGSLKAAALLAKKAKRTRANLLIYPWATPLWLTIQLPLAFLSIGFLGVAYVKEVSIPQAISGGLKQLAGETAGSILYSIGGTALSYVGEVAQAADWLFEKLFGFSLLAIGDPTNWFTLTYFLVVITGVATLLLMSIIYVINMINPFFGKGAGWKIGGFLIAFSGYLIPGLNILPWFMFWSFAIWLNPE